MSASSDPEHGDVIFWEGFWRPIGGTSAAAPLWAALTAVANQGCASAAGLLNARLYAAGAGPSPPFHDISAGNNYLVDPSAASPRFPATAHYDLASGWGRRGRPRCWVCSPVRPPAARRSPASGPPRDRPPVGIGWWSPAPDSGPAFPSSASGASGHRRQPRTHRHHGGHARRRLRRDRATVTVTTTGTAGGTSAAVPGAIYTFVSPRIEALVPARGPTSGGGLVTVRGSDLAGATSVRFGSAPASFTVISATSLVARVPPGPSGGATVDVSVRSPDGVSPRVAGRSLHLRPPRLLAGGLRRRHLQLRRRPLLRLDRRDGPQPTHRGHGRHPRRPGLLAGGLRRRHLQLRRRPLLRLDRRARPQQTHRGHGRHPRRQGLLAGGLRRRHLQLRRRPLLRLDRAAALNKPIVGMAATPDGRGYWLVASDGGIFSYGDAPFYGSTGGIALNRPDRGHGCDPRRQGLLAGGLRRRHLQLRRRPLLRLDRRDGPQPTHRGHGSAPDGRGYWLVASDGGIFGYGDASFYGSAGATPLNQPVVGMAAI